MSLPAPVQPVPERRRLVDIEDEITELAAHIHAATFRLLELIREFDRREGWGGPGLKSCAHWLNWKCGIGLGAATASFALPFLFDIVALGPLVILAVLTITGGGLSVRALVVVGALLAAASMLAVALMPVILRIGFAFTAHGALGMPRLRRFLADTHRQVIRARRARIYGTLFGLSLLVRVLKYSGIYALLFALLKPEGYTLAQLHAPSAFLGFCAAEMAASLPFSGVAGFGAYEGTWSLVFQLLGFPQEMASASGVSHHLLTQVYGYALGLAALLAIQIIHKRKHA